MTETYLFLGGPRDGERLPVEPSHVIQILLPDNTEFRYHRMDLWGVIFYIPSDWTTEQGVRHLSECYSSCRPIDTGERFLGCAIYLERKAEREGAVERFKSWLCGVKNGG